MWIKHFNMNVKEKQLVVEQTKKLRKYLGITEENACSSCNKRSICKLAFKSLEEIKFSNFSKRKIRHQKLDFHNENIIKEFKEADSDDLKVKGVYVKTIRIEELTQIQHAYGFVQDNPSETDGDDSTKITEEEELLYTSLIDILSSVKLLHTDGEDNDGLLQKSFQNEQSYLELQKKQQIIPLEKNATQKNYQSKIEKINLYRFSLSLSVRLHF